MRKFVCLVGLSLCFYAPHLLANGVCIENAEDGICLELVASEVDVIVANQVSIVTTTQTFRNNLSHQFSLKYAFPLYEDASATSLSWQIGGEWFEAGIGPTEPDTIPGGSNMDPALREYLGETPLYFSSSDFTVLPDSLFKVSLTYVQLLEYEFGDVHLYYPNDYTLVQGGYVNKQELHLELNSLRTIDDFQLLSHEPNSIQNDGNYAVLEYVEYESVADTDYHVLYSLSLDELGLFSMSTYLNSADIPDEFGNGFFTFIAEPDGSETSVMDKVFTLIIDRSGSMSGDKIVQARAASSFIVENLNEGDRFNLVDYATEVSSFADEHVDYNYQTESEALAYISGLNAEGWTNISGAFDVAVPQFHSANDNTANIIIFFTDGLPTAGITNTERLLEHIHDLITQTETNINLFTFGIGHDVNHQLLTLMASENQGLSVFLEDDEVEDIISNFYLMIRNPVLLNTSISFIPDMVIREVYPDPLPNLYQGSQMIVSGRYSEPSLVTVQLDGTAFGNPVGYQYDMDLADTEIGDYQFLTKLWAKSKIEHLLIKYYSLDPDSPEAGEIMELIIEISVAYGVLCPFTGFEGPADAEDAEGSDEEVPKARYTLLGNYPNPFDSNTTISFHVNENVTKIVYVRIYNVMGRLVRVIPMAVRGNGVYGCIWNGLDQDGRQVEAGTYFYIIDFGDAVLSSRMVFLR